MASKAPSTSTAPAVMVVDDSDIVRQQVRTALVDAGMSVIEACDGVEALALLEAHPDTRLVICDVNMPKMGGIELLERLREIDAKPTVVMLTTEGQPELVVKARSLGAKGWLIKPCNPRMLIAAVTKLNT